MIPFLDLNKCTQEIRAELDEAYHRFMDSGWYVLGKEVLAFEKSYASYCDAAHCVGVATGLDALTLALRSVEVGPGDEVIVPSNTYIATWLAVSQIGATIVPVEPDSATFNMQPNLIEQAVTDNTKCILPVNLYGQSADYDAIIGIARGANAHVVVDNAQAHGARYKGRPVGGIADLECHSFYPSKNLGAYGEAGAVTTNNATLADRIAVLRNYGSRKRYYNEVIGTNSRIDTLQAAFLRVKLRHLDQWNDRRRRIARLYCDKLTDALGVATPFVPTWADPAWHLFVIQSPKRDELRNHLEKAGIATQIHYPIPPHQSDAYRKVDPRFGTLTFPIATKLAQSVLSLPIGPHMKDESVVATIDAIHSYAGSGR